MIEARTLNHVAADSRTRLLKDVDLTVRPGERIGIIGPSGSGKSTLGYHLGGLHTLALEGHSSGSLKLGGRECIQMGRKGFAGFVLQNPENQIFCDRVEDEVTFGMPSSGKVEDLLEWTGLAAYRDRAPSSLSLGWKQRLSIASMLAIAPSVLVLDEPTNYLDALGADTLFEFLGKIDAITTLIIDHDETRLRAWATRLIRIEKGLITEDGPPLEIPERAFLPALEPLPAPGEPLLAIRALDFAYTSDRPLFRGLELELKEGEIVALLGPNGSGKSTLLRLVKGLLHPTRGNITAASGCPLMEEVGLVFQNPDEQLFAITAEEECAFLPRNQGASHSAALALARASLDQMKLEHLRERLPFSLSYGEKRRLTLASVLVGHPRVLCLDEPTAALDQENLAILAGLMRAYAVSGGTILFATHDAAFAKTVASRSVRLPDAS
jgi:energy-coupling factor transport system ATP-binding protein